MTSVVWPQVALIDLASPETTPCLLNAFHHTSSGISPLCKGDPCWENQIRKHYDQHEGLCRCWTDAADRTISSHLNMHAFVNLNKTEDLKSYIRSQMLRCPSRMILTYSTKSNNKKKTINKQHVKAFPECSLNVVLTETQTSGTAVVWNRLLIPFRIKSNSGTVEEP